MPTYPLSTLACTINASGISSPSLTDILESLKATYRSIYGSDVYLEADSQDGQLLAAFAAAIYDCNQQSIAVYNSFSPSTAQGVALSNQVKINGLARLVASRSTCLVTITGQVGTTITSGRIGDRLGLGTQWDLPASVTIPVGGNINVTATCTEDGDIEAEPFSLTEILTPTRGWQTVTNPEAAVAGNPVEDDATLRQRQAVSTALPAQSPLMSIVAQVANLDGIGRYKGYENDTSAPDADGIPGHSIAIVVEGGVAQEIAEAIALKKTPGTGTYGDTDIIVYDEQGVPNTIWFFTLDDVPIELEVDITALTGYVSTTGDAIIAAIVNAINALEIGEDSYLTKLYTAANLNGDPLTKTYVVTAIRQGRDGNPPAAANIVMAFNEAATCETSAVTLNVT